MLYVVAVCYYNIKNIIKYIWKCHVLTRKIIFALYNFQSRILICSSLGAYLIMIPRSVIRLTFKLILIFKHGTLHVNFKLLGATSNEHMLLRICLGNMIPIYMTHRISLWEVLKIRISILDSMSSNALQKNMTLLSLAHIFLLLLNHLGSWRSVIPKTSKQLSLKYLPLHPK